MKGHRERSVAHAGCPSPKPPASRLIERGRVNPFAPARGRILFKSIVYDMQLAVVGDPEGKAPAPEVRGWSGFLTQHSRDVLLEKRQNGISGLMGMVAMLIGGLRSVTPRAGSGRAS